MTSVPAVMENEMEEFFRVGQVAMEMKLAEMDRNGCNL